MAKVIVSEPIRRQSAHDIYKTIRENRHLAWEIPLSHMAMLESLLPYAWYIKVIKWRKDCLEQKETEKEPT